MNKISVDNSSSKLRGFTLAEVLITISIIGIVAALTIPSIYHSNQRRIDITNARKAEYEVSQIALRLQAECPRLRTCVNGSVQTNLNALLNNARRDKVGFDSAVDNNGNFQINVSINGEQNSLQYTLNNDGTYVENTNAHTYICGKYQNEKECQQNGD